MVRCFSVGVLVWLLIVSPDILTNALASQVKRLLEVLDQDAFELIHGTTDTELLSALFVQVLNMLISVRESQDPNRPAGKTSRTVMDEEVTGKGTVGWCVCIATWLPRRICATP